MIASRTDAAPDSGFIVVCAHFYPELTPELREQYGVFRSQFVEKGIPLITLAIGAQYERWSREFPEVSLVEGDLLFQKERLWSLGATIAEQSGFHHFLCLDADVVFQDEAWNKRLRIAFEKYDVIHPFERIVHLYEDARIEKRTTLGFPLRISLRPRDLRVARIHRRYRYYRKRILSTRHAFGFGLAFNSHFLHTVGLYEHAIVGGGDWILWKALICFLHEPTKAQRDAELERWFATAGLPENRALQESISSWVEAGRSTLGSLRVGYLKGVTAIALPLGRMKSRRHTLRSQILRDFDPARDLHDDPRQGLAFTEAASELKKEVARFMSSRIE